MSPTFVPPTVEDTPWTNAETPPLARRLFRHYGAIPRGRSVLKIAGTYRTVDTPDQLTLATATEVYLGGHEYQVSDTVATALTAAGYGAYLDTTQWSEISGDTWGSLAGLRWNEV